MVVSPNFHFAGDCMEAIKVYEKAFHAATLCVNRPIWNVLGIYDRTERKKTVGRFAVFPSAIFKKMNRAASRTWNSVSDLIIDCVKSSRFLYCFVVY